MPPARLLLWLLSLACLAVAAHAFSVQPPPVWVAALLLLLLATVATVGVLFPRLEVFADVLQRAPGRGAVALTFDDGPHPESTRRVLSLLAEHGARATFFVVGHKAELYPDVVREIVAAGHTLGLHGYAHDRLYSLRSERYVRRDVERTQAAIEQACGVRPTLFRPPVGFLSFSTSFAAERAGIALVAWSARGLDGYRGARAERVLARLLRGLEDGAIVLLHDAAEREDFEPVSVAVLPALLAKLREQGLRAVTVEELFA